MNVKEKILFILKFFTSEPPFLTFLKKTVKKLQVKINNFC